MWLASNPRTLRTPDQTPSPQTVSQESSAELTVQDATIGSSQRVRHPERVAQGLADSGYLSPCL